MDQALKFEETVASSKFTLFFDVPESVLHERLMNRGKTSGRADDNEESIKKRFKTFVETSMPVVDMYSSENRLVKIDATRSIDEVYTLTQAALKERDILPTGN